MEVKLGTTCFHLSQSFVPHCPPSPQTLASTLLSPSSNRRNFVDRGSLLCRNDNRFEQSTLFGSSTVKLRRSRSFEISNPIRPIRRSCSAASLDAFSDDEFSKKIQELTQRFQLSAGNDETETTSVWHGYDDLKPDENMERIDISFSLRILKKIEWEEDIRESDERGYCPVKKAFSSMVFMIRELHGYTLRLREILFFEDLQTIFVRVQNEIHASFVWLFQQVFSHTPTLMVYVMILLANFTVYSMGNNPAFASSSPPPLTSVVSVVESHEQDQSKFDSSIDKTFSVSSSSGKTTAIGGNNGGGGKVRPVGGGIGDDGKFVHSDRYGTILPDSTSQVSSFGTTTATEAESVSREEDREEEVGLWDSVVEEASRMREWRDEVLDHDTMKKMVSPVTAKIESDDYTDYLRTELLYQTGILREPNNPLLLANFAQFLYLVAHDYDRSEEYFKRAVAVEPPDAEAYDKYATFLWRVRNDLWAAEETFLEAISADPSNAYYAANYAHFLWNTGGEDTCFPLESPDATAEET